MLGWPVEMLQAGWGHCTLMHPPQLAIECWHIQIAGQAVAEAAFSSRAARWTRSVINTPNNRWGLDSLSKHPLKITIGKTLEGAPLFHPLHTYRDSGDRKHLGYIVEKKSTFKQYHAQTCLQRVYANCWSNKQSHAYTYCLGGWKRNNVGQLIYSTSITLILELDSEYKNKNVMGNLFYNSKH